MTEQNKTKVPAELIPAGDYPVVSTNAVMDKQKGKTQEEVNEQVDADVEALQQADTNLQEQIAAEVSRANAKENSLDNRLSTVEELAEISVEGGTIGIASSEDFTNRTPAGDAKIPTVGAIMGSVDEEPTPNSDNLVKSGGVEKELPVFHLTGDNNNPVSSSFFEVKAGNTYRVWVKNPDISMEGVTRTTAAYKRFACSAYDSQGVRIGESTDYLIDVGCDKKDSPLDDYYDFTTPANTASVRFVMRAGAGEVLTVWVEDVTSLHPIQTISSVYIDKDHLVNQSGSEYTYRQHLDWDCAWIAINPAATTVKIVGLDFEPTRFFFDSDIISTEHLIGKNNSGKIPKGAVYCLINIYKPNHPEAFDGVLFIQESNVGERLDEVKENAYSDIYSLVGDVSKLDVLQPIETIDGKFVSSYGVLANGSSYDVYVFPVEEGNFYAFSDNIGAGYTSIRFISWWDSERNNISVEPYSGIDGDRIYYSDRMVKAPHGAAYAYLSGLKAHTYPYRTFKKAFGIKSDDLNNKITEIDKDTREIDILDVESTESGWYHTDGEIHGPGSESYQIRKYSIEEDTDYIFSGATYKSNSGIYLLFWMDENEQFISYDYKTPGDADMVYKDELVHSPHGATQLWINTRTELSSYFSLGTIGDRLDFRNMEPIDGDMSVVLKEDNTFSIRFHIDDEKDGVLTVGFYTPYGFKNNNSIMHRRFYVGGRNQPLSEIFALYDTGEFHNCYDTLMPLSTWNLGPIFANHGYCTPYVVVPNHGLTNNDIGSEWVGKKNVGTEDEVSWLFTLGHIKGDYLYLLPVIDASGGAGHENKSWKSYTAGYPTQITRNIAGGETLQVTSSGRFDYQVAETKNIKILIDGAEKPAGTYRCKEVALTCEQVGYNPIEIQTWWQGNKSTPDYTNVGTMAVFRRQILFTGCDGFLSLSAHSTLDIQYPVPASIQAIGVMLPLYPQDVENVYNSNIFIPKVKKARFKTEFINNKKSGGASDPEYIPTYDFIRDTNDCVDIDNMPDRAYCYLTNKSDGSVFYGCAGGVSILRGATKPAIRNTNILIGRPCSMWSPGSSNKVYFRIFNKNEEQDASILGTSAFFDWEVYMCWYKPENDVQSFFYKEGNEYILYIHTKSVHNKEAVKVPSLMNGLSVKSVVEQSSNNISYLNDIIVDGKLYINSGSDYEYIVLKIG